MLKYQEGDLACQRSSLPSHGLGLPETGSSNYRL
ncbi:hypothetical protein ACP70R_033773 [Stipagrostis hirtigluma subsp. patula]